jgi:tRNA 2-thiouridine synthesizing protein E
MAYQLHGNTIATDEQGYLLDYLQWQEALVPVIAEQEDIQLNDAHWQIIRFVRQFYEEYDTSPAIRALVKALSNEFGPEIGNSRHLQRLLPKGPAKMASKLAGLPKPAKCL